MRRIKGQVICLLLTVLVLAAGCGSDDKESIQLKDVQAEDSEKEDESLQSESGKTDEAADVQEDKKKISGTIFVDVCGEVASPGVYELPVGSRVYEAIDAAGGMLDTASVAVVNKAQKLEDGQQIYVPSLEEAAGITSAEQVKDPGAADDGRVNLNTAGEEELMTLSGIGEAKARAIIAYREEHGGFSSPEDIMQVEGIKEGTYAKIKEQIKTE